MKVWFTVALVCCVGCSTRIWPGPDAQKVAQRAMIRAKPGDVIAFGAGTFDFTRTLSLDVEGVTIRGAGSDKTILRFANQTTGSGGEGLLITTGGCTIEDLAIEDPRGDALKVSGADGVTIRRVRAEWTEGPSPDSGGYGLYSVESRNVLIEHCVAIGASDAGIYVGQCENAIVRRNEARQNVAGIEIENTIGADVYENLATDNTGGMLVFALPNLPKKEGRQCRVFGNVIDSNNRENFARPGQMVGDIPPGVGLLIIAHDDVEVFENTFSDNQTANLSVLSFLSTGRKLKDAEFDPYCERIHIHNNLFEGGGTNPGGRFGDMIRTAFGQNGPDILYDGIEDAAKQVDGQLPDELALRIHDNGDATFANLNLAALAAGRKPDIETDLSDYAGSHPPLVEVALRGAP